MSSVPIYWWLIQGFTFQPFIISLLKNNNESTKRNPTQEAAQMVKEEFNTLFRYGY
jgi:hypothetical protein